MDIRDVDWRQHPRAGNYAAMIEEAEKRHNLPAGLLGALVHRESRFNPRARSHAGAVGIAQLMPVHHKRVDPLDPEAALDYAASYLSKLNDRFDSWHTALAAYNHGQGNIAKYMRERGDEWEQALPAETRNYLASLSPERVEYPAPPPTGRDEELAKLAKEVDETSVNPEQDVNEALAMLDEEPKVEENLRKNGWFIEYGGAPMRGVIGAARGAWRGLQDLFGSTTTDNKLDLVKLAETSLTGEVQQGPEQRTDIVNRALDTASNAYGGKSETTVGAVIEGGSQFGAGLLLARGGTRGALGIAPKTRAGNAALWTAEGAIADFTAFQGREDNIADLAKNLGADNDFTRWLAGDADDNEAELRAKNALTGAGLGLAVDGVLTAARAMRPLFSKFKAQEAEAAADARPEMDIDMVAAQPLARENPKPAAAAPEPVREVAPEGSAGATPAAPKVAEEFTPETGEITVRTENGVGIATETDNAIRINRVDVAEGARGKGEGLSLLRQFAQRAASRGLPLFSDISVSPAQARVYEKLKAEGFDVRQNEATVNPETGNLVSADPRKPVFEVAPKATDEAPAPEVTVRPEAQPVEAPVATKAAEAPKADYAADPLDVTEARLREEIGLTPELVAEVRGKIERGEVRPEEVADLIGINGDRIDWSGVADEKAMAGLLNTISRVIDDTVGGAARYARVSVDTVTKMAKQLGASAEDAFALFESLKANGGIEARIMAARAAVNASAAKLYRLAAKISNGNATPEELLEFAIHDRRHMLLQAVVRGSKSMVARALRMMRESVGVDEAALRLSKARKDRNVRRAQEEVDAAVIRKKAEDAELTRLRKSLDAAVEKSKKAEDAVKKVESKPTLTDAEQAQLKELRASLKEAMKEEKAARKAAEKDPESLAGLENAKAVLENAKKAGRKLSEGDVADALSEMGYRPDQVRKLAQVVTKARNAAEVNKISRTVSFGKQLQSRLATLYINNILSGLPTLMVNITSGWLKMAESVIERYGAAALRLTRGGDKYDWIAANRAALATRSMWSGAFKAAAAAWKEGLPQTDVFSRAEVMIRGGAPGSIGEAVITAPSRGIMTVDEYFKNVFYQQELAARATEVAAAAARRMPKGKAADAEFERVFKDAMENPSDDLKLDAIENARYNTFQNALESNFTNGLVRWTNGTPLLKFVVPFVRTPVNIMKQAVVERTPLGFMRLLWRSDLREAIAGNTREGNTILLRAGLGTAAMGVFFQAALDGKITGSRKSLGANKNSEDFDQEVPYTFMGVQYNRLDPYGTVIVLTADLAMLYREYQLRSDNETEVDDPELLEAFGNIVGILSTNILDKTFFKGISDLVEMASSADSRPDRVRAYFNQLGTNLVPFSSMQRNIARSMDEWSREAHSFNEKLMLQTPGLRDNLPKRYDYLGRPVREPERVGPDVLSPILISREDRDPAAKAFAELGLSYQMPSKDIGGVRLSAEQYSRYTELRGSFIRERIEAALRDGNWYTRPIWQRQDMVKSWQEDGGRFARHKMMDENRDTLLPALRDREAALEALRKAAE